MSFAPRLLQIAGEGDLLREIEALGIPPGEAAQWAGRACHGALRLSGVPPFITALLQDLENKGGITVLAGLRQSTSDVLLLGPLADLRRVALELANLPEAEDLSAGMVAALDGRRKAPAFLVGRKCRLSLERPLIMGVLNATPDSFFADSRSPGFEFALRRGVALAAEGADIIDIGGESTRPGSEPVPEEEEIARIVPLIEALRREVDIPLSIDTTKSRVAREAIACGADFINDISGLRFDCAMADTVAAGGAGLFLMHTRGRPDRMQEDTVYQDLMGEILCYLSDGISAAVAAGVPREKLAVDPGIGFAKSVEGNLEVLRRLPELAALGAPILIGTSRKGFIGRVLRQPEPGQRLVGTLATVALGVAGGAHIVRVHDVGPARESALMAWAIVRGELPKG